MLRCICAAALLTLVACTSDKSAPADDSGTGDAVDLDGDGYGTPADCDDSSSAIHPGADERCDGIDDDCDGEIDEGEATDGDPYFEDADGDGFGDPDSATLACAVPSGFVDDDTDCDDADSAVFPGADERCDGIDDDCDGLIDDEDDGVDLATGGTFYADADEDGWGDADAATDACVAPDGSVDVAGDCDDGDALIHPDADEVCDGIDDDCDGLIDDEDDSVDASDGVSWWTDADADGYGDPDGAGQSCVQPDGAVDNDEDCDDSRDDVSPGAAEVCDDGATDEDCDGLIDDADDSVSGAGTWYLDEDEDGWGNPDAATLACEVPSGALADGTDCDDADEDINPDALEICDEQDNDCDELIDDEDDSLDLGTAEAWYADADEDGFGDADTVALACVQPDDAVANAEDCDDHNSSVNPDAEESSGNGIDEDCDGFDGADSDGDGYDAEEFGGEDCDDSSAVINPSASDVYGDGIDQNCDGVDGTDSDGDGVASESSGGEDCDDSDPDVYPGGEEVLGNGSDDDCEGTTDFLTTDDLDAVVTSETEDYLGRGLGAVGDLNSDGWEDLVTGLDGYLVFGPLTSTVTVTASDEIDGLSGSVTDGVGRVGDIDGDGYDDLVLGSGYAASYAGGAWLVYGPMTAAPDVSTDAAATITGSLYADTSFGDGVYGGGDLTGDGHRDFTITSALGVFVFDDELSGDVGSTDAGISVTGPEAPFGSTLPGRLSDLDGDGVTDLLVSSQEDDSSSRGGGGGWLFLGPVTASPDIADAGFAFEGDDSSYMGWHAPEVGDLNGDGYDDVVMTCSESGRIGWLTFYGPFSDGETAAASDPDAQITPADRSDCLTRCVELGPGDLSGDDVGDLLFSDPYTTVSTGGTQAGRVWLLLGPVSGTVDLDDADGVIDGVTDYQRFGYSLTAIDVDGDELPEALVSTVTPLSGLDPTIWMLPSMR